jgi:hypothetical protein
MRLKCPSCNAEMDLDVLLAHEEGRHVLAQLLQLGVPMGALLVRYVGLFRPGKRALSMSRTLSLLAELWPDMQRQAITRKGREWPTTPGLWQQAIEQVLAARDKGNLTLPLTSHGYLFEVLLGLVDKAEGQAERERENAQRGRAHVGGPASLDNLIGDMDRALERASSAVSALTSARHPVVAAPAPSTGPSPAARKILAEIQAKKNRGTAPEPSAD